MFKRTLPTHSIATLLVILSAWLFSLQIIVQYLAHTRAVPVLAMVVTGMLFTGIVLIPFALKPNTLRTSSKELAGLMVLAIVRLAMVCSYFLALSLLPASNAVLLFYLAPLGILLQLAAVGKEQVGAVHLLVFLLAFGGIAVALNDISVKGTTTGLVAGISAAVFLSWDYLLTKKLIPTGKLFLNFSISSLLLSLIILILAPAVLWFKPELAPPFNTDYLLVSLAFIPVTLLPRLLLVAAIQFIGASKASLYSLTEPIFVITLSCLLGWEIFTWNMFGGVTMVISALLLLHLSRRNQSSIVQ